MGHSTHEMLTGPHPSLRKAGAFCAAFAVSLLATPFAQAQEQVAAVEGAQAGETSFVESLIPGFQFYAAVDLSESYVSNAAGTSTGGQDDYLTMFALSLGVHEHSRRVSLDASYSGAINYYAKDSQDLQFTNNLQAVANVIAIPDYLNFVGRAFAQPVVLSSVGVVTANGRVAPNGYDNGYGYSAGPIITFHLNDFASSETTATYSGAYFTDPAGASALPVIPGVAGPSNTISRSLTEKLSSGPDFTRLSWTAVGLFSEMDRRQGLFSEKAGLGHFQFALTREISLLATGGYDAISNTVRLRRNISGPVATGGIGLTFGDDFSFQAEVGQKYNSASYQGFLRWSLTPTSVFSASATDGVSTPEGQLLNNLAGLTASSDGRLTTSGGIYSNGSAASLAGFNAQPLGSSSYDQSIARYQQVSLSFLQDFERDHFNVTAFGTRQTILDTVFFGRPVINSWGAQASYSHDITRQLLGSLGGGYFSTEELGGSADSFTANGQLSYSLSPLTSAYFRTDYVHRISSSSLQSLSPFTGNLDDVRVTIGLRHTL